MIRKSKRFQITLVALTIGLLTLNTSAALAQIGPMPGSGIPTITRPTAAPRMAQLLPQLYSDIHASKNGVGLAGPLTLAGKMQYQVVASGISLQITALQLKGANPVELAIQHNNLAWVQEHLGQTQSATQNYEQALALMEANGGTQIQLAVIEYNMGDLYFHEHHYIPALHYLRSAMLRMERAATADHRPLETIRARYNQVRRLILADPHVGIRL